MRSNGANEIQKNSYNKLWNKKVYEKLEGMPAPNRLLHPFQFLNSCRFPHQLPRHRVAMTGRKLTKRQQQDFHRKVSFLLKNSSPVRERFQLRGYLGSWRNKVLFYSLHYMYRRSMLPSTSLHKGNSSSDKRFQVLFTCTPLKIFLYTQFTNPTKEGGKQWRI